MIGAQPTYSANLSRLTDCREESKILAVFIPPSTFHLLERLSFARR
jgi:hypothetical protein